MANIRFSIPKRLVASIVRTIPVNNFIETGTSNGDTSFWAATLFKNVHTIEVNAQSSKEATSRPNCPKNINFIAGNSVKELPKLISQLEGRSVFFLDTHSYTQGNLATTECSVIDELKAISACEKPIIFINDARCFLGPLPDPRKKGWPTFEQIYNLCKGLFADSYITIIDGVIVCVPKDVENVVASYWVETFDERNYIPDPEPKHRSIPERAVSKLKRMLTKKKPIETETVAYNIKNSVWFEKQCKIFYETHPWLKEQNFKSIIDIGANVGQFGKKIRQYYPEAHLYSFEPIPLVYRELMDNFKGDKNFTGFNAGLGDKEGKLEFYMNEFSDSSSMLKLADKHKENYPFATNEKVILVDIKTLDGCIDVNKIEKPYLLKLDVQGFEEQVIRGGMEILRNAEMVITESSYKELYEGQSLFDSLYDIITAEGFQFIGNLDQMNSPFNGEPLQGDAIFVRRKKEIKI